MGKDYRGARDYPQTQLPPLPAAGVSRVAMDRADGLWKVSQGGAAYVPILSSGGGVLQTVSTNLAADITTTATPPIYTTFLTAPLLTTTAPASRLRIDFHAIWRHTGPFAGNVAVNYRFRLNGVLLPPSRGATDNSTRNQFKPIAFNRVLPIAAGPQVVLVEWSGFALGANTLTVSPGTLPDLSGAQLIVQELPP